MYRACLMNSEQTSLHRILWRDSEELPIDTYELLTVTYGTASASYLATRCLKQLSIECSDPVISEVIGNHFYVDDLLTGADSITKLSHIIGKVKSKLLEGGFELAKWTSNNLQIIRELTLTSTIDRVDLGKYENTRTLGLLWDPTSDEFRYQISEGTKYNKINKRTILSDIAQVFDPLGLLCPVTINAKIILQEIWQAGLNWDEALPNHIQSVLFPQK
ncbi:uncharacterized protein [Onthophagus taurus]|uniref:uncharacterized protein n=1 Tax=Onthophagus taurus TaxID=166361 RepID=UPI0039BE1B8C